MKKLITMRIEANLLGKLDKLKQNTKISRTVLIEEAIKLILQLYTSPVNEEEMLNTAKKLLKERADLYKRLANK